MFRDRPVFVHLRPEMINVGLRCYDRFVSHSTRLLSALGRCPVKFVVPIQAIIQKFNCPWIVFAGQLLGYEFYLLCNLFSLPEISLFTKRKAIS
jgi:hypothetical protein